MVVLSNSQIYSVNLHIQPEYRKIRTRKNSVFWYFSSNELKVRILFFQGFLFLAIWDKNRQWKNKSCSNSETFSKNTTTSLILALLIKYELWINLVCFSQFKQMGIVISNWKWYTYNIIRKENIVHQCLKLPHIISI